MNNNTFTKEERLCSKRLIDSLFHSGSSFVLYPFRIVFCLAADITVPAQVIISVSKRRYKKAVTRNLLKRRMREAYRTQKKEILYSFLEDHHLNLLVAIQYVGKTELPFSEMKVKLALALNKLKNESTHLYLGKDH
ncbi:ribonuclease P protein component [Sphingobacterium spiritivorum]|uniref:ribonuclease P protein component n=1 Tax=Sphingobacterium spiritivorum TaxID=258 RepID=UPI001918DE2A|nr:ribonuclease P protein component [Sphingobacterium spiritivorum]QQT24326.1 ribonuclease P protein component [Sphingobacterium spiritivorum]